MAQPTIKKQVTIKKTVRRKVAPKAKQATASPAVPSDEATVAGDSPVLAKGKKSAKAGKGKKGPKEPKAPSYTVYALLALLGVALYIALITIMGMELSFLSPAFPKAVQMGGM